MVAGFSEGKMARASVAPGPCPCADGDLAGRTRLRFAFATADRWQRHGPIIVLCNHFWPGSRASGGADRISRLEWNQEGKAGVENRPVSHVAQSNRHFAVCSEPRLALANISRGFES